MACKRVGRGSRKGHRPITSRQHATNYQPASKQPTNKQQTSVCLTSVSCNQQVYKAYQLLATKVTSVCLSSAWLTYGCKEQTSVLDECMFTKRMIHECMLESACMWRVYVCQASISAAECMLANRIFDECMVANRMLDECMFVKHIRCWVYACQAYQLPAIAYISNVEVFYRTLTYWMLKCSIERLHIECWSVL